MDKYLKQLLKEAKKLRLEKEDKIRVRENLYAFLKDNPISEQPPATFSIMFKRHAIAFVVLILVVSGSGISFAAEGSSPGDLLYPIKRVNERVVTNLVLTEESKLNWELKRVERRLVEAEKLAAKEELAEEQITVIEEEFEQHTQTINEKIVALQLESKFHDAAELSSDFETSLKAHDQILTRIIKSKTNAISAAEPLTLSIRAAGNTAERARVAAEDSVLSYGDGDVIASDTSIEAREIRIENRAERVNKMLDKIAPFLSEDIREETLKKMALVGDLLQQSRTYIAEGEYGKSFILLLQASRIIGELEILLSVTESTTDKINHEKTISIDDCKGPILESFPRQCATPEGNLIIKEDLEIKIPR